jgi:hypothetical protein
MRVEVRLGPAHRTAPAAVRLDPVRPEGPALLCPGVRRYVRPVPVTPTQPPASGRREGSRMTVARDHSHGTARSRVPCAAGPAAGGLLDHRGGILAYREGMRTNGLVLLPAEQPPSGLMGEIAHQAAAIVTSSPPPALTGVATLIANMETAAEGAPISVEGPAPSMSHRGCLADGVALGCVLHLAARTVAAFGSHHGPPTRCDVTVLAAQLLATAAVNSWF